jgi:hypothetical protein
MTKPKFGFKPYKKGEIIYYGTYDSFFKYVGKDEEGRLKFDLFFTNYKKSKVITNYIAFPESHLSDPSYNTYYDVVRIRYLENEKRCKIIIKLVFG